MKRFVFHPLLISLFPALTLLAHNIDQVKPSVGVRSLAISFLAAMALFALLRLALRSWQRSAILTSLTLVWFFSYGQIYNALKPAQIAGVHLGRHGFLLPVWLLTLAVAVWWAVRKLKDTATLNLALNIVALALIVFPAVQIGIFEIRIQKAWTSRTQATTSEGSLQIPKGSLPPDIYYFILDSYSRDDILQSEYGYDNKPFLDDLTQMGFFVARCSQSNYAQTELSMASSLNFNYLPALGDHFVSSNTDRSDLWPLMKHSAVRQMLEQAGYTSVAFETGYYWTHWEDADYFLAPPHQGSLSGLFATSGLNSFEVMYLRSTAGLLLVDFAQKLHLPQKLVPDVNYPASKDRERVLFVLGQLQFNRVPSLQSPKLVYIHLIVPHPPFVFGPNGERVLVPDKDKTGYRDQVIFINKRIEAIVKDIIAHSDRPPVIVIQGDHGSVQVAPDKHMAILNAYYLPGADYASLYTAISPVNTFRVIFNQYFGGDYPMLKDISYYSTYQAPYNFTIVPEARPGCEAAR